MKLFLDLRRLLAGTCSKSGCLGSVSCLNFSNLVVVSLRISGGAMPASLYTDVSGVGRRFPVIIRQALLSSALILFAWLDFPQTAQQYSAVEYESASAVVLGVRGSVPQLELAGCFWSRLCLSISSHVQSRSVSCPV